MKISTYFLSSLLLFVLVACGEEKTNSSTPSKNERIPVKVISLTQKSIFSAIQASGTFSTKDETILAFKVGGIVSSLKVQEGDPVRKGQVLATLDLTEVEAGLSQAKLAFEKAKRDFERAGNLYRDSVATLEQYQNAKTALDISAEQLKTAEFNRSYAEIRATQNGYVLRKFVNEGQLVTSGSPILQINGANQGNWVLQVSVNDQNWSKINLEDPAIIFLEENSQKIPGKIIRKSQASDPVTGAYWVEILPENTEGIQLASGMFARAEIRPDRESSGWSIPYGALLDAQGKEGFVFVTEDGQTAKRVKVSLGRLTKDSVEVLGGLENYSQLIVSGSAYLADGSTISLTN